MEQVECVVVGAGVVGLAVARRLALAGREVLVLESEGAIGTVTSSRNSEVIHAGIYYPHNSLMARFCVIGREMLYAYCKEHGVPHTNCGKLIVATSESETARLAAIRQHAALNGVELRTISAAEARALEPALHCMAALLSPATCIVDSHGYMLALRGDAEAAGASIAFKAPLTTAAIADEGFVLGVGGGDPLTLGCKILVNAAGLNAPALARSIEGMPGDTIPTAYFAKGNYFSLTGRAPFSRLIYPVPVPGG